MGKTKTAIIFDVDGTLVNIEHRVHHVSDGKKDWKAFYEAIPGDSPNPAVCFLAEIIAEARIAYDCGLPGEYELFVCSGRSEEYRRLTEQQLMEHVPTLAGTMTALLMRPENDYRSDVIIKRQMLSNIRNQGYEVLFAVDDRQRVVDMWRTAGVTCLQCAPSDWDTGKVKCKPGYLHMMVGPSGAGKSRYVRNNFDPRWVVSSDDIREQICDSFKDQTKNHQVFQAMHAMIEARIHNGLPVVVDATNLRNRDRKAILELVPKEGRVQYYVINRSRADKMADGGWRNEITIKGMSLIDKHEHTFKSNISAIMSGDGDERVTVYTCQT